MKKPQDQEALRKKIRLLEADLEKRDQMIKALIEGQNIQNTILEKSMVGYYIISEGKFRMINPIAVSYTGYAPDELIGKKADTFIHPQDKNRVRKNRRAMLDGKLISPYEYRIITRHKEIRWIMEIISPIQFAGKPAILGNSMDITQRKLTEERLIESENLYRAIFETTGTSMIIYEEDKTISLANSGFQKLTGYRKEAWEGKKKWTELVAKKDLPRLLKFHRLRRSNPDSVPKSYEYRMRTSGGKIKNVLSTVGIIPNSTRYVASVIDITDLKAAEEALIKKSESLSELNTALRVLLKQRENDKNQLETSVLTNVKELVLPYLEKLKKGDLDRKNLSYVDILASNLENILSPFSRTISAKYMSLTSREIEVANFIKEGRSSKEISDLLSISSRCVDVHRYHIRKKLGLNKKHVNLRAYLNSLT